ncbi:MAG: sugar porter family MFS transporter [Bryobacteraceae bacterium]
MDTVASECPANLQSSQDSLAVAQMPPNRKTHFALVVSTCVSSLGGFLFGYDNIVISGAIGHLSRYYGLEPVAIGWAAGCGLVGCLVGSACSGAIADRFGLKKALYTCAACFALSSIGVWLAGSFSLYVFWRVVGGIGIGAASIVAPMYIAEIAPAAVRGRLVVLYQFGIVSGILIAVVVNMLIERAGSETWRTEHGWRWMFAAGAIPAIIFALTILFSKESPRWLMKVGRERQAKEVLAEIEGCDLAVREASAIANSLMEERGDLKELFAGPFRRALLIGFALAAFSQTSGITALLSFLPEVFKNAGRNAADAFLQSVLVGIVNLAFTAIAIWSVDRAGRRTLILLGTALQGARVIAGVKTEQKKEASSLAVDQVLGIDNSEEIAELPELDAIADTVDHDVIGKLIPKLKPGGVLGSVLGKPKEAEGKDIRVEAFMATPNASLLRQMADAVRDKKLDIPIVRRMRLSEAGEAQTLAEEGSLGGKILLIP